MLIFLIFTLIVFKNLYNYSAYRKQLVFTLDFFEQLPLSCIECNETSNRIC